jgi:aminoglycoside phosphotransferase (APT) family kinase protein
MVKTVSRDSLQKYFSVRYGECRVLDVREIGKGAHGTGFEVKIETRKGAESYVLKSILPEGLGHDYPSDRAAMHLLALETFGGLPRHVRALDVLSLHGDGSVHSIGGGKEYFLLMEHAEGTSYFSDLRKYSKKERLDGEDREKIAKMADYLSVIHSVKKASRALYLRKLRDIIGHGECLMGVFDIYPEGIITCGQMADIEKKCIDHRARLKDRHGRLSQIHGDFHPGNIWWLDNAGGGKEMCLLDRSRGPWGEPADDVTALTINYLFFSVRYFEALKGPYLEALGLFFDEYLRLTGDLEIFGLLAPFYAFRGAVVANPVFYPEPTLRQRRLIFRFVHNVLDADVFDPANADRYVNEKGTSPF